MEKRKASALVAAALALILAVAATTGGYMVLMPGKSYRGLLPPLSRDELRISERLRRDVSRLAGEIGERNIDHYRALGRAADYISEGLSNAGLRVRREPFTVEGKEVANLVVEVPGNSRPEEMVLIGAHYDSAPGTPGANDNASGVAALLEIARTLKGKTLGRTLRLVFFVNEEAPYFQGESMGSVVHARRARKRGDKIAGMISIETIGFYSDKPKSQEYPAPFNRFYPDTGNFIAFVADLGSRNLLRDAIAAFRATTSFPSEGVASPAAIPGIGWSDHWSFWQAGYPALMVTDTAPFRYHHYHQPEDTPDKLDYGRMARVVTGLAKVTTELCR